MKIKLLALSWLLFIVACGTPTTCPITPTPTSPVVSSTPTSVPSFTSAPSVLGVRERIVLRDLPGIGRNPYAIAVLDGKVYTVNSTTDNVAVIQNDRVTKFIAVGKRPNGIIADAVQKRLYVSNGNDKTISLIANDQVTLTTSIGEDAEALALMDNRLFVGARSKGLVLVLDPNTLQTQTTITIPGSFGVINFAGDPVHHRLYAAIFDKVAIIDATTLRVARILDVPGSYYTLLANPANDSVLVAVYESVTNAQYLVALDPGSGTRRGRVKIGGDPRGAILNADGSRIYIANSFSNTISIINARDLTVIKQVSVALRPHALALDESARRLYVANLDSDNVSIIDTSLDQLVATIPIKMNLTALITNETNRVYIASASTDSVFVLEGARIVKEMNVGRNPVDLARDSKTNRLYAANSAEGTLAIIDETNFDVRITLPITSFLTTVAVDSARARLFAGDVILDANTLATIGRLTMRGITLNSVITPELIRLNPSINRIYAFGGNGVPGSNSRRVTYSMDGTTMQQRTTLAYAGNSEHIVIDLETNRVFMAGMHPLAFTYELGVYDANDAKVFGLSLPTRVRGMAFNPQTHHLFLAQENSILVLDSNSFGQVMNLSVNAPGKMVRLGNTIYVANRDDGSITLIEDVAMPTPPSPTPTWTPSPLPTLAPLPTVARTATPSARITPLPTCAMPVSTLIAQRWANNLGTRLGCPIENARTVNLVFQMFEHGTMFWREDEKRIIVLFNDRSWSVFDDTWGGGAEDSCPSIGVSVGIKPKRGFGKVWCEQSVVRAQMGAATSPEQGPYASTLQRFDRGWVFGGPEGGLVYVLFNDGKWE